MADETETENAPFFSNLDFFIMSLMAGMAMYWFFCKNKKKEQPVFKKLTVAPMTRSGSYDPSFVNKMKSSVPKKDDPSSSSESGDESCSRSEVAENEDDGKDEHKEKEKSISREASAEKSPEVQKKDDPSSSSESGEDSCSRSEVAENEDDGKDEHKEKEKSISREASAEKSPETQHVVEAPQGSTLLEPLARSDVESANYFRVISLIITIGSSLLRDIFYKQITPGIEIKGFLRDNRPKLDVLKRTHVLTARQYALVTAPSPDVTTFDISLLVVLLRNICTISPPAKGWTQVPPDTTDQSLAADLLRLKDVRNRITAHSPVARLATADFEGIWQEVATVLHRLAIPADVANVTQQIAYEKTRALDPTTDREQQLVETIKKWHVKEIVSLLEQLTNVNSSLSSIKKQIIEQGANEKSLSAIHDRVAELEQEMQGVKAKQSRSGSQSAEVLATVKCMQAKQTSMQAMQAKQTSMQAADLASVNYMRAELKGLQDVIEKQNRAAPTINIEGGGSLYADHSIHIGSMVQNLFHQPQIQTQTLVTGRAQHEAEGRNSEPRSGQSLSGEATSTPMPPTVPRQQATIVTNQVQPNVSHPGNIGQTVATSNEERYKMNRNPRGYCLIINNRDFYWVSPDKRSKQLHPRNGTDKDAELIEARFSAMNFIVDRKNNQTNTDMKTFLEDKANNVDHSNFDCFVCCILTHGVLNSVYGSNGVEISIKDLTRAYQADRCTSLSGKPKLFFIQACQGGDNMGGVVEKDGPVPVTDAGLETYQPRKDDMLPTGADFLLGYATVPGYVSIRNTYHGSWYIRTLCQMLERYAHSDDLLSILTKVNNEVSKYSGNIDGGVVKQIPAPMYTLRKKLFFS